MKASLKIEAIGDDTNALRRTANQVEKIDEGLAANIRAKAQQLELDRTPPPSAKHIRPELHNLVKIARRNPSQAKLVDSILAELGTSRQKVAGTGKNRHWVAELIGLHPQYHYERRFLNGKKDYSKSNGTGSRGVFIFYTLESGHIYEVQSPKSWGDNDHYFCRVDENDGDIVRMEESEVRWWLTTNNQSSSNS